MKTLNIWPRQSGKTTQIYKEIYEDIQNGIEAVVFTMNTRAFKNPLKWTTNDDEEIFLELTDKNVIPVSNLLPDTLKGREIEKIYIDEYFIFHEGQKEIIYHYLKNNPCEVIVYSSLDKNYSAESIELCKLSKTGVDIIGFSIDSGIELDIKTIEEYYFNLITEPDSVIVFHPSVALKYVGVPENINSTELSNKS